jgi:hypothetical protein
MTSIGTKLSEEGTHDLFRYCEQRAHMTSIDTVSRGHT